MEIQEQYVKSSKLLIQATERRKLVFLVCLFLLLTLNKYGNIFVIKKTVDLQQKSIDSCLFIRNIGLK